MNLFSSKLDTLKSKSSSALGIFKKTVADLQTVNQEITTEVDMRTQQQQKLEQEKNELVLMHSENFAVISKINEFLGAQIS